MPRHAVQTEARDNSLLCSRCRCNHCGRLGDVRLSRASRHVQEARILQRCRKGKCRCLRGHKGERQHRPATVTIAGQYRWRVCAAFTLALAVAIGLALALRSQKPVVNNIIASCAVAAGGSISAQSISIQCGPSADDIKALVEQVISNHGLVQLAEDYRKGGGIIQDEVVKISAKLHLKPEEVSAIIKSLSSEIVIPETAAQQFAQLTREYIDTAVKVRALLASDPSKGQADTALKSGDILQARRLIGQAKTTKVDDLFDYPPGTISRAFSGEECQFWVLRPKIPGGFPAHTCDVELNKIYAFVGSNPGGGNDQPGFKVDLPSGVRTIYLHYRYVRGPLRTERPPDLASNQDTCTPNIYWETYYANGGTDSRGGEDLDACDFVYPITFRYNNEDPPPLGFMVSIRDFEHKIGTSKSYFGGNFVFAFTQ